MNVELRRVHRSKNKRNLKLLSFLFNLVNTPAFLSTYYNKHVEEIKKGFIVIALYTVSQKTSKIIFVITMPNFHQI